LTRCDSGADSYSLDGRRSDVALPAAVVQAGALYFHASSPCYDPSKKFSSGFRTINRLVSKLMADDRQKSLDKHFIRIAIDRAWSAAGKTDPNPLVGALVVRQGEIVAEGIHEKAGDAHAEVAALAEAGPLANGATLYVTLEPCAHHGKTPPCVDRIIESKIKRVVTATRDPFDRVNGRGIETLRQAGIEVDTNVLQDQALLLNLPYFKRHAMNEKAPLITVKAAVSLDGKISAASGERTQITSERAQMRAHRLRATRQTIIVGIDTLLVDRPRLDCRLPGVVTSPIPVILDTRLRYPEDYRWPAAVDSFYLCTGEHNAGHKIDAITKSGGTVLRCRERDGRVDLNDALEQLSRAGLISHLVEGGGSVFTSFIQQGLWSVIYLFSGPILLGEQAVPLFRESGQLPVDACAIEAERIDNDVVSCYMNGSFRKDLLDRLA
jgi:diaminohydroxyphosphoribosylaminopyrimidine deaminase/5-amino-6-(5-phosphoribosylamino)uracil reductase